MIALQARKEIQLILDVRPDGVIGPRTLAALNRLVGTPDEAEWPPQAQGDLTGDGTWTFTARIDGDDIVCENISITCFGGNGDGTISDPQDSGDTASGRNTKNVRIVGCSIAMDGRQFSHLSPAEHRALDGAPIPRLQRDGKTAWGTPVIVTIGDKTITLPDGIVDLGPGKQASKPGDPHALDLTVPAAAIFAPDIPLHKLSTRFSAKGSFRIVGGAKLLPA